MAVGDTYDVQRALPDFPKIEFSNLQSVLRNAGPKDTLKKVLNVSYGKIESLYPMCVTY